MDSATVLAVAVGLAMDAFSVSIAYGICAEGYSKTNALKMASSFGAFQMLMPVLGWLAGEKLLDFIAEFDHWIAFGLLLLIGCKMIYEAAERETAGKAEPLNIHALLILSIATSIDALAVGLSFAFLKVQIATPIMVIGAVTFTLSLVGAFLGNRLSQLHINKIGILGGLILIAIGSKILLEHLTLG
ncbi:MAG: manganese efflux pump MntP family protein [Nitrososphaerota archaeon]|nr:manganese efflux pump MntP family protein [Nitrososphaerota archaeon]